MDNKDNKDSEQTTAVRDYSVCLYVPCEAHGWHRWSETIQTGIFPEYLSLKQGKSLPLGRRMRANSLEEYVGQVANMAMGGKPAQGQLVELTFVPKFIREYADARCSMLVIEGEIDEEAVDVSTLGEGSPFVTQQQPEVPEGWTRPTNNPHLN